MTDDSRINNPVLGPFYRIVITDEKPRCVEGLSDSPYVPKEADANFETRRSDEMRRPRINEWIRNHPISFDPVPFTIESGHDDGMHPEVVYG